MTKFLLLLTTIFTSFQVSALTLEDAQKCFSKNEHTQIFSFSVYISGMPAILDEARVKVEQAKDCNELKAKLKPIDDDVKKVLGIEMKYRLKHDQKFKETYDELKKSKGEPNLEEFTLCNLEFMEMIEKTSKNNDSLGKCSFNKGISVQCPEGRYKYLSSENLINVNSSQMKKVTPASDSVDRKGSIEGKGIQK